MTTASTPVQPLLQNAAAALQRGDKRAARQWAQAAASLAPQSEEPWLLLAAVSEPRASVAYLKQALLLNPGSERALRGMRWAQSRLAKRQAETVELTKPVKPAESQPVPPLVLPAPALHRSRPNTVGLTQDGVPQVQVSAVESLQATQPTRLQSTVKISTPRQINPKEPAPVGDLSTKPSETKTDLPGQVSPAHPAVKAFWSRLAQALSGRRLLLLPVIFLALLCLALAWAALPAGASFAQSLMRSAAPTADHADGPSWSQAEIAKPAAPANVIAFASPVGASTASQLALSTVEGPTQTSTPLPPTPTALPTDTAIPPGHQPAPAIVTPSAPGTGKYILISISQQHLYAYQDSALVGSFVASTGMNNSTRAGVFQVLDKIPNAYGATWNIWMPNWLGIYYSGSLENGIHALPILSNGARLWAGYLGTPISFGCIVLGVEESQWLYNWADIGATVEIMR
jgi:lipoprotein-anchoring transpeptidase ErfK/SrfK